MLFHGISNFTAGILPAPSRLLGLTCFFRNDRSIRENVDWLSGRHAEWRNWRSSTSSDQLLLQTGTACSGSARGPIRKCFDQLNFENWQRGWEQVAGGGSLEGCCVQQPLQALCLPSQSCKKVNIGYEIASHHRIGIGLAWYIWSISFVSIIVPNRHILWAPTTPVPPI